MGTRLNIRVGSTRAFDKHPGERGYARAIAREFKGVENALHRLTKHLGDSAPGIMLDVLEPTFDLSQKYVPVDTGKLKGSGYLEITQFRGKPRVELGYGRGGSPGYAAIVHERTDLRHKEPWRAKFLEAAMVETLPQMLNRLKGEFRKVMPRG